MARAAEPGNADIFISYQWDIQKTVNHIHQHLVENGFRCWMDVHRMEIGDPLYGQLISALENCKVMLACITLQYMESVNCCREVIRADNLKSHRQGNICKIIPILLEDMEWLPKIDRKDNEHDVTMILTPLLYVRIREQEARAWEGSGVEKLMRRLRKLITVHRDPPPPYSLTTPGDSAEQRGRYLVYQTRCRESSYRTGKRQIPNRDLGDSVSSAPASQWISSTNHSHEQQRTQKKTFTKWVNLYLCKHDAVYKISDLYQDIKDGVRLLLLLEVLSRERLPGKHERSMHRVHCLFNVKCALDFLETRGIKMVNINPTDIVDGKPSIILDLIWKIILLFDLETIDSLEATLISSGHSEEFKNFKGSAKLRLLAWMGKQVTEKYGIPVNDFADSWRDGKAFNAMVHNIDPTLVDMVEVRAQKNRVNLENAFSVAEKKLGIPRLLDPEDVDVERPDKKSIMTYLAQFVRVYSADRKRKVVDEKEGARKMGEQEKADLESLIRCMDDAKSATAPEGKPIQDLYEEYKRFMEILKDLLNKNDVMDQLSSKRDYHELIAVKPEEVDDVHEKWLATQQAMQVYRWRLDSEMPGELGQVGQWLSRAERCLYEPWPEGDDIEEIATKFHDLLLDHQEVFKNMNSMRQKFRSSSQILGKTVPREQITDVQRRLNKVYQDHPEIYRKLEFLELKHQISVYFLVCERKLKMWSDKFGSKEEVTELLKDYTKFVIDEHLYTSFDKAFEDFRRKAENHKKRDLAGNDVDCRNLDRFVTSSREKWRKLAREIQYAQPLLEEVIANWRRYKQSGDALREWLPKAERAIGMPLDDRQAFFADMPSWTERYNALNQAGNFLIENSVDPVGLEVKNTLLTVNLRWKDLMEEVGRTQQLQEMGKLPRDYNVGSKYIYDWLDRVEALVASKIVCSKVDIIDHLFLLEEAAQQEEEVTNKFKEVTGRGQALCKESSTQALNEIISNLKFMKERILKCRKDVKENMKLLKSLLPNVDSVESGIKELMQWIQDGENLLEAHAVELNSQATADRLQKHQQHFIDTAYYKSMLEGREKMFGRVMSTVLPKMDTETLEDSWREMKERFQALDVQAKRWDETLDRFSRQ